MPVPKKGDQQLVKNYRPVSVLPIVAKVFEAMVYTQLYNHLETNSLTPDAGFCPLCSTQDALIRPVDDWWRGLDREKLEAYGVTGKRKAVHGLWSTFLVGSNK